jgi:hypothetical protein
LRGATPPGIAPSAAAALDANSRASRRTTGSLR